MENVPVHVGLDYHSKSVQVCAVDAQGRYEPRWRELSASMAARGKHPSVIIGAVANRWLRGLFHQLKETHAAA